MQHLGPLCLAALPLAAVAFLNLSAAVVQNKAAAFVAASAPDRAQIRKETVAPHKARRPEHGEAGQDNSGVSYGMTKAVRGTVERVEVREETAAANKAGNLPHDEIEGKPATNP